MILLTQGKSLCNGVFVSDFFMITTWS